MYRVSSRGICNLEKNVNIIFVSYKAAKLEQENFFVAFFIFSLAGFLQARGLRNAYFSVISMCLA